MKNKRLIRKARQARSTSEFLEPRRLLSSVISFGPHVDFTSGTSPVALVAADFNGDGNEDLAVADGADNKVYVFFGNGAGAFSAGPVLSLSSPPVGIITGVFNGDARPDIAVACTAGEGQSNTSVDVFLNTGAGTFGLGQITTVETGAVPGEVVPIAAGDFNTDGHLDVAVGDYHNESISILAGTGTGTFTAPINYQSNAHPTDIVAADFDKDKILDLAVASTISNSSAGTTITTNDLSLLPGGTHGNFSGGPNIQLTAGGIPTSLVVANLTAAATPGLVVGSSEGTATLFTNTNGTFAESAQAALAAGSTALAVGDFDLDGNTDIVSADGGSSTSASTDSVTVIQGIGAGMIGNATQFPVGSQPAGVVVADFNNDGKPDIATANQLGGTVSILINNTAIPLVSTKIAAVPASTSVPAGSPVIVTATITPSGISPLINEQVPAGTVNLYDGPTLLSTVTLTESATQAVFSTENLSIGAHHLRATYSGDDAYASSNSAFFVETITPTATEGPDLIGTFVSSTLPAEVAPGESGTVSIRVTNQGNFLASGSITNQLYLSLDTQLDGGDLPVTIHGALAHARLHLKPNQSLLLAGSITIPQNAPLASYFVVAFVNATGSLAESVATNNVAASPSTYAVADVFGDVGGRKGIMLHMTENNGTSAIFRLTGPGKGMLNIGDNGADLVLDQTTAASILTVTTKGGGIFALHDLTADSAVGSIRMPGASVSNSISLLGGAGSITIASLGSAGGVAALTIGGGTVASITAAAVSSASLITTGGIRSLSVGSWGSGQITAPWIGSLRSKQNFTPGMQLSGTGAPGGVALNSAIIGGSIGDAIWTIAGVTNRISAGAFSSGWSLDETGLLKSISSAGAFPVTINATDIYTIQVRGSAVGASVTASSLIRSILITGPVDATTHFSAPTYGKAILGGAVVNPLTDSHFSVT